MKSPEKIIEWFEQNGAEVPDESEWPFGRPNEWRIETDRGTLELSLDDGRVSVYSGMGDTYSYAFKMVDPSIELLDLLLAQTRL